MSTRGQRVGIPGGKAHKRVPPQVRKRAKRANDPRVRAALKQAAQERARLDAVIAAQQAHEAHVLPDPTPVVAPPDRRHPPAIVELDPEVEAERERRRRRWPLGEARHMRRMGYDLDHVIEVTGWDERWLIDVRVGRW